jgi:hypothetical protein
MDRKQAERQLLKKTSDFIVRWGGLPQQHLREVGVFELNPFSLTYDALSSDGSIVFWFLRPYENIGNIRNREPDAAATWLGGSQWYFQFEAEAWTAGHGEIALRLGRELKARRDKFLYASVA